MGTYVQFNIYKTTVKIDQILLPTRRKRKVYEIVHTVH